MHTRKKSLELRVTGIVASRFGPERVHETPVRVGGSLPSRVAHGTTRRSVQRLPLIAHRPSRLVLAGKYERVDAVMLRAVVSRWYVMRSKRRRPVP